MIMSIHDEHDLKHLRDRMAEYVAQWSPVSVPEIIAVAGRCGFDVTSEQAVRLMTDPRFEVVNDAPIPRMRSWRLART
jgi:hypothetical protein